MRINNLIKNYDLQTIENKSEGSSKGVKVGQIIKAKISQIINDVLLLETEDGKSLEAKTMIPLESSENQILRFKVKQANGNQVVVQPMPDRAEKVNEADKRIIDLLKKLDIDPEKEKIEIVKSLIDYKIPVTREKVLNTMQSKVCFEKMEDILNTKGIDVNKKVLSENIKDVIKDLLKFEDGQREHQNTNIERNIERNIEKNIEKSTENLSKKDGLILEDKKNMDEEMVRNNLKENPIKKQNINIKNMNFEKILFLLKNNVKVNIGNMTNLNNLVSKDFNMTKQLDEIIHLLKDDEQTNNLGKGLSSVAEKIKEMIYDKKFEPEKIIKEMHIKLELIKQVIENMDTKESKAILENISNLKNNLDFTNKLQQFQTYMQIPILLDQEHKNIDLFISKDGNPKKKINPKDIKILVALETKNMEKVQSLVEIKDQNITCNFRVTDEHIKKILSKYESRLENALMKLGFKGINIKYAVSDGEINILDAQKIESKKQINFIDLRV